METFVLQAEKDFSVVPKGGPAWLRSLREKAYQSFLQQGFPTTDQESWKYTNVDPIVQTPFHLVTERQTGIHHTPEGAWVGSLLDFLVEQPGLLEQHLARTASVANHPFVALNTAFLNDGKVVYLPKGVVVRAPISLVYPSSGQEPFVRHPRTLIIAEPESEAVVFEHYWGSGTYFTNAVTEIDLAPGSGLEHYKLQEEGESAYHLSSVQVTQARESRFTSNLIMVGAHLSRSEIGTVLQEEGAECALNGLYSVGGDQHVDNQTWIDHASPHGTSREIYKGILDGRATAVFNGGIIVRPDAQKTSARQLNKNLLLSNNAIVNTKPLLEILANDVKCNHGATIGRLDENQIFYLRSRGLGEAEARGLLTYAFANELLARMKWHPICLRFQEKLFTHLTGGRLPSLEEMP